MKRKRISLFLIAALLLTQLPILSAGAASEDGMIYTQDFTDNVTAYGFTTQSGLGAAVTKEAEFKQMQDGENRFVRFYENGGNWGRCGFEFDKNGISEGQIRVQFRFRPFDKTFASGSFGSVLIGNSDAKFNWLSLINVQANGTLTAGCANSARYPLTDSAGANAVARQNVWYSYDAVVDLDTHSLDIQVTEDGTNAVYTVKLSNLPARGGKDEWNNWPDRTNFKDIGCLFPMDLDDIKISYMPLMATGLGFLNALGTEESQADLHTKQIAVHFNFPVNALQSGAVMLDGMDYSRDGMLSDDGKTYTFTLAENLIEDREYSVTVFPEYITPSDSWVYAGESAVMKFTPQGLWKWSEDFEEDLTVYNFPTQGGGGSAVTDKDLFQQMEEDGNRFGRFNAKGENWGRLGVEFDENGISGGQLNVRFRFRPYEKTFTCFGSVLIGNCDKKFNWLSLINVQKDGTLTAASANSATYPLKDSDGITAKAVKDTWYTYDAAINLDTHSLNVKVTEEDTNNVYTVNLTNLEERGGTAEWLHWPDQTNFKDIACLCPIDLDDIEISYLPLSVINLNYIDGNGDKTDYATDRTEILRLNFSAAVQDVNGKISLDGQVQNTQLSADGRYCDISLPPAMTVGSTHTLCIDGGIIPLDSRMPASEEQNFSFTVVDINRTFSEDYEGGIVSDFVPFVGSGVCNVVEQNGNHYGKISTNWGRAGYRFKAVTQGKMRVRFDFMFDSVSRVGDDAYSHVRIGHENGNADGYVNDPLTLLSRQGSEIRFAHHTQNDTQYRLGTVQAGVWYHYDATLDLDTHTMHLEVGTDEGTVKITKVIPLKVPSTTSNDRYIGWPNDNIFDQMSFVQTINVDNIRIEKTFDPPNVIADSIRPINANGKAETDLTAVNPAVNGIQIDFGTQMNADSVTAERIQLTSANGEAIPWNDSGFDDDGKVYTINFDGLKSNTTYTLTVSGEVENGNGRTMGVDKSVTFTTGAGTFSAVIDSVTAGGATVTNLAALKGTAQVKVTVPNASGKDSVAVVYLAYYDANNKILGIQEQYLTAPTGKTTTETLSFIVNKPAGTACAKILLWSGGGKPLQAKRELK